MSKIEDRRRAIREHQKKQWERERLKSGRVTKKIKVLIKPDKK